VAFEIHVIKIYLPLLAGAGVVLADAARVRDPEALARSIRADGITIMQATPSLWQAVTNGFLLALLAGGLGAARGLAPWRRLAALVPPRPRSVIMGMLAALAVLISFGAVMAGASLATHLSAYKAAVNSLSPGLGGAALLLLAGLSYLPNSVFWAIAYMLGPGFAFGAGTAVSPSGSALGAVPAFPMLAALPVGPKAAFPPWLGFFILALPYLAGALAGLMTVRIAPTPFLEAAPLWGLLTGSLTALVIGFGARLSGGPLGAGRLAFVGPAGAEVGLVALLEVGVTAALVAGAANWLLLRRHIRRLGAAPAQRARESALAEHLDPGLNGTSAGPVPPSAPDQPHLARQPRISGPVPAFVVDETDDAGGHRIYYDPWAADREA